MNRRLTLVDLEEWFSFIISDPSFTVISWNKLWKLHYTIYEVLPEVFSSHFAKPQKISHTNSVPCSIPIHPENVTKSEIKENVRNLTFSGGIEMENWHDMDQGLYPFHDGGRYHIETSPLICGANFYMITASVMKGLRSFFFFGHFWVIAWREKDSGLDFLYLESTKNS